MLQSGRILTFNFKITKNENVCTHDSTPPDYCELGPVLLLGEGLLWKFNGKY